MKTHVPICDMCLSAAMIDMIHIVRHLIQLGLLVSAHQISYQKYMIYHMRNQRLFAG